MIKMFFYIIMLTCFLIMSYCGRCQQTGLIFRSIQTDDSILLKNHLNADSLDMCLNKYSLLTLSMYYRARKCFDYLLSTKINIDISCNGDKPPIFYACKHDLIDMLKKLLANGASLETKYRNMSPLQYAKEYESTKVYNYLLNYTINLKTGNNEDTGHVEN